MADGSDPPTRVGLRDRARYRLDRLLGRGTWAVLLMLGAATIAALLVSAILLRAFGVTFTANEDVSFQEDFWQSTLRVLDAGTMAGDVGWGRRVLSLVVTMFGILIAGTLIGIIAAGVEQRVEEMQRGRSVVIERGHVLILGASARLPVIINQLTLASRNRRANTIVILADQEPRSLADEVRSVVPDTRGTRLVFRSGDPTRRAELGIVNAAQARVVIVLADRDAEGDAGVVKSTLAVGAELDGFHRVPVVAELSEPAAATSLALACGGQLHAIVPLQGIARITAFTLGAPGLNHVVEELLDFRGADIHVAPVGDLAGARFGDTIARFAKAHCIGRFGSDGVVALNPAPETRFDVGDRLIVIADDDGPLLVAPGDIAAPTAGDVTRVHRREPIREHIVVIGWNRLGALLLDNLGDVVAPGSTAEVIYDSRIFEPDEVVVSGGDNLTVISTPSRSDTWELPAGPDFASITSIVFLGRRRGMTIEDADSRTLLDIMLVKRAMDERAGPRPRIIAELLNADNVDLARMSGADDFLVSDAIASRIIAQLAEQPERRQVLLDLYAPGGASVQLAASAAMGVSGSHTWGEVVHKVYAHDLLAIGWRRAGDRGGDLGLNPALTDEVELAPDDDIVVIG